MNILAELRSRTPHLTADVELFSEERGGRKTPALLGWSCPLMLNMEKPLGEGWAAWPLLGDTPLLPGDKRRLGFVFANLDGPKIFREAGEFFLWELDFIGHARGIS
jgi:hypothetical protein